MSAYLTDSTLQFGLNRPPVLIAGSSEAALDRAGRTVEAIGLRIADRVTVEAAVDRIDRQASASAFWLELDADAGPVLDTLLDRMERDAHQGRYAAVVSTKPALLDPVFARAGGGNIDLLVDADDTERAAVLSLALARREESAGVSDIGSERSSERLRQLSEEVGRIAANLARLSNSPGGIAEPTIEAPAYGEEPAQVSADVVRSVIRARRLRARYFAEDLFADPAWDMLLDLLQAEIAQLRVPVSSLCIAAAVPATTALRWLKTMTAQGLFVRRADPHDGRRVFVELAPETSKALRRYFADVGKPVAV